MKERPIIFSAPMVRAILDGGKTQTRRIIRPQPTHDAGGIYWKTAHDFDGISERSPYGRPGDRLWVKETWRVHGDDRVRVPTSDCTGPGDCEFGADFSGKADSFDFDVRSPWRSPLLMPRWASRITLKVTDIRVERLHAITEADVKAEGFKCWSKDGQLYKWAPYERHVSGEADPVWAWKDMPRSAVEAFARSWDTINGKRAAWATNPWVWVVSFERVKEVARA